MERNNNEGTSMERWFTDHEELLKRSVTGNDGLTGVTGVTGMTEIGLSENMIHNRPHRS